MTMEAKLVKSLDERVRFIVDNAADEYINVDYWIRNAVYADEYVDYYFGSKVYRVVTRDGLALELVENMKTLARTVRIRSIHECDCSCDCSCDG